MRAELQSISEKILKSIKLLEQRMDIGSANHRLEEFNALSESPSFWDNPQKAQKLMQERQFLVDQLEIHKSLKLELEENIELIELLIAHISLDSINKKHMGGYTPLDLSLIHI